VHPAWNYSSAEGALSSTPVTLWPRSATPDASRLLMTRALRGLADGLVSVLLAAHLGALGLSTFAVMGTPRIGAGLRSAA